MSKKYEALAKEIVSLVGGKNNVKDVYHCQTRLRFTLADESIAKTEELKTNPGVATVIQNAGVYQVVIGTHVADVFEEIEKLVDLKTTSDTKSEQTEEKKSWINALVDFVSGIFMPIIPALSGAGMVKAVLALLVVFGVITSDSQTYYLFNLFADSVFYFLPIMLAFTEAQKLKCNPILAAGIAAMLVHPNWSALVTAGEPVYFFGIIPFSLVSYSSSVIPIILIVFVQSYVEKFLNRYIPKSVNLVFVPMLTFLIMGTLAFSVLGPIGNIVGQGLAVVFNFLSVSAAWVPAVLVGGFLPIMVMFGIHTAVGPLGSMQLAERGYDSIFGPGCVCSNIAQASAGLVVAIRTKDEKMRQIATSGSITAYMGITEPILYGVNLPKKYPLIASMIGGGLGGLYAGLTHTHRFATGSSGLPAVLLYIGDNTMTYFYNILIALAISAVTSFVVCWALSLVFEKKADTQAEVLSKDEQNPSVDALGGEILIAPLKGKVLPLSAAEDEAFASGALGDGIVIEPSEGRVVSPVSGTITALFPSKHAIGIQSDSGAEILIHVGINTVELNGQGFDAKIEQGAHVSAGDELLTFDLDLIRQKGYPTQTMIIITNSPNYQAVIPKSVDEIDLEDELIELSLA